MLLLILFGVVIIAGASSAHGDQMGGWSGFSAFDERRIVAQLSDEEGIFDLANRLFEERDFLRAAQEYRRFFNLFPNSARAPHALLRAGLSFMEAEQWLEAAALFEELEKSSPTSQLVPMALYLRGKCLMKAGRMEDAHAIWSRTADQYPDSEWGQRAGVDAALSRGEEGDYAGALKGLISIGPENRFHTPAHLMARELDAMEQIPHKSTVVAGILSAALPGAGQFYLGRYQHGTVALILNSLTIWGVVEALENGDNGLAAALMVLEAIWYSASVVGSVSAAHKMNQLIDQQYFHELEQRYFFRSREEQPGQGALLKLRFAF